MTKLITALKSPRAVAFYRRVTKALILTLILAAIYTMCHHYGFPISSHNKQYVEERAVERWESLGFRVVGYEGYESNFCFGEYGGANVWYQLQAIPDNGIRYTGYLQRWGDEVHVYNLRAIDAIKPK